MEFCNALVVILLLIAGTSAFPSTPINELVAKVQDEAPAALNPVQYVLEIQPESRQEDNIQVLEPQLAEESSLRQKRHIGIGLGLGLGGFGGGFGYPYGGYGGYGGGYGPAYGYGGYGGGYGDYGGHHHHHHHHDG